MGEINIIEILVENQDNFVIEESVIGTPIVVSNSDFYISIVTKTEDAVTYKPQFKTDVEKEIARNNINAVENVPGKILSENDFTNAYKNDLIENTRLRHTHNNLNTLNEISETTLSDINNNKTNITDIKSKIPNQASSDNQLADKNFVNSSINSITADYITSNADGDAFATKEQLLNGPYYNKGVQIELSKNDYALVNSDETHNNAAVRYVYDGVIWAFQYIVNPTPFTAEQLAAINSGITRSKVDSIPDQYVKTFSIEGNELKLTDNNNNQVSFRGGSDVDTSNLANKDGSNLGVNDIESWKNLLGVGDVSGTIIRRWE